MKTLNQLTLDEKAEVTEVLALGALKRRFSDIGLINGTVVQCVAISHQGDPKAYLIRGAVIAIRNGDSALIKVGEINEE